MSARVSGSGAAATEWVSESSVVCKMGAGAAGSAVVGVTAGRLVGSRSAAASYSRGAVSSATGGNYAVSGGESMTVTGRALGASR